MDSGKSDHQTCWRLYIKRDKFTLSDNPRKYGMVLGQRICPKFGNLEIPLDILPGWGCAALD